MQKTRIGMVGAMVFILTSCKFDPGQLADNYCACMKKVEQKKENLSACEDLAESNYLKLQDDDEALKKYSRQIAECLMYDEIRTEKDIRDYRRKKRSEK